MNGLTVGWSSSRISLYHDACAADTAATDLLLFIMISIERQQSKQT